MIMKKQKYIIALLFTLFCFYSVLYASQNRENPPLNNKKRCLITIAATAAIGNPVVMVSMVAVFIAIFFAGFSIIGGQPALNALAATYYPTSLRSTGIGWSLGIGRIGSVLGPVLGGALMHLQWSSSSLFLAAAVPACVSLIGVLAIARTQRNSGPLRTAAAN